MQQQVSQQKNNKIIKVFKEKAFLFKIIIKIIIIIIYFNNKYSYVFIFYFNNKLHKKL